MVLKDHVVLAAADLAAAAADAVDEVIGQLFVTVELQTLFFVDELVVEPLVAELVVN
jgi:hypothetical protein